MYLTLSDSIFRGDDEVGRLAALRGYQLSPDDTDNALFEDLVTIARAIGGTRIAYISLVEAERQWFKVAQGVDIRETPRGIAFCDHAIRQDQVMVVLDAHNDSRFAANPLVTSPPNIRFYAGAPIINPDGYALGTICLSDPEPRDGFDHAPLLAALARQVAALLELRKQLLHQQLAADLAADQRDRLWDNSLDLMLIARGDGTLVAGNPAWEDAFGPVPQDGSANVRDYFSGKDAGTPITMMANGQKNVEVEREMLGRRGETLYTSWNLAREDDLIFGIARDVTRARAAEAQLAHVQRMESIGQLTGGIAHDFNNLLTIILGNLDIAQRRVGNGDTARAEAALANARDGAQRAASLTQRLLAFARRQSLSPSLIQPADLLRDLAPLARQALDERYGLDIDCPDALHPLLIDVSQLENAILNLVVNARDAMADQGRVTIALDNVDIDAAAAAASCNDARAGRYVRIAVADTGSGIPPEIAARIFEPFYTTKDVGRGTGLGLSQVQGFVVQSGGFVTLDTQLGAGTTVSLWLPAADDAGTAVEVETGSEANTALASATGGRILLVEDNADLRLHIGALLEEEGFDVAAVEDGLAALAYLDSGDRVPDLVLSDITMPRLDGHRLADAIRERLPRLPVLLMTGYDGGERIETMPPDTLITKPFSADELIALIRKRLRRRGGA